MIKLNNKGFAVSTILYGILSLTIIILMMIFGVMKSSKDMNQDLAESIEGQLNNCVLSEVKLEECYFKGSNCDYTEYNSCNGRKVESNLLASVAAVGDFVNYDAGTWTSTVAVPSQNYEFGGYTAGASRNNSVRCVSGDNPTYNGWRILSIKDGVVTLVHAGISECYYAIESPRVGFRHVHLLTGRPENESYLADNVRDWSNYVNGDYASSAGVISSVREIGDLAPVGASYLLPISSMYEFAGDCLKSVKADGSINEYSSGVLGIRPIVILKQEVKTLGSITNTYGKKEWLLAR